MNVPVMLNLKIKIFNEKLYVNFSEKLNLHNKKLRIMLHGKSFSKQKWKKKHTQYQKKRNESNFSSLP